MTPFVAPYLAPAFPEIFMAVLGLMLLILGVARKQDDFPTIANFTLFTMIAAGVLVVKFTGATITTFDGMFVVDHFSSFIKALILMGSAFAIFMSTRYAEDTRIARFEYPVLVLFSTIGMMLMVSANNLMSLYMALELQSLPLYVLASIQRDTLRSTEAGLKYFVLGALSSGMLLYGASLIYGFCGTTDFTQISALFSAQAAVPPSLVVGMVLLLSGLAFKIAAVPFHMWTPDVYEGAPTSVTAFFAIAPKIAALALMVRVFAGPFGPLVEEWRQIIVVLSMASMILGAVAGIAQRNIKRLLAYSSIGHMGYAMIGLAAASVGGVRGVLIYAAIYMAAVIGAFAVVLFMKQKDRMLENISDLSGLSSRQPLVAFAMAVLMFSMAGVPPLAGFFGKLFIFQSAVDAKLYALAIVGVLTSVISAFYYLRIIKIMYFDVAPEEGMDAAKDGRLRFALGFSVAVTMLFIAFPAPLLNAAQGAALSLMSGRTAFGG